MTPLTVAQTIAQLNPAATLTGAELVPIYQNGTTVSTTIAAIRAYISFGITVGVTSISSGTNGHIEYDNNGVLGELGVTGTGNVVLSSNPAFAAPNLDTPPSGNLANCTGTAPKLLSGVVFKEDFTNLITGITVEYLTANDATVHSYLLHIYLNVTANNGVEVVSTTTFYDENNNFQNLGNSEVITPGGTGYKISAAFLRVHPNTIISNTISLQFGTNLRYDNGYIIQILS